MKKRMIGTSVAAAAMAMVMSIPAFAMGWTQDGNGWRYYTDDNGWYLTGQWFTDPADGSIYHLDPDGYMMTDTHVGGYWLGADGRRVEKTEEDIAKEAEKAAKEASKPSPSKERTAATSAATAAKSATAATSTTRLAYQAEMKVFMDKIYITTADSLGALGEESNLRASTTKNNIEETYRFVTTDGDNLLTSSMGLATNVRANDYRAQSFDLSYNRALLNDETHLTIFDKSFKDLVIAALGDTAGEVAYNYLFEQLNAGNYNFEASNNTDAGNTYTMTCSNGTVSISVVCSEYKEPEETEGTEGTSTEAETVAVAVETTTTSSVITVGAGSTAAEDDDDENTSAEVTYEGDYEDTSNEDTYEDVYQAEDEDAE